MGKLDTRWSQHEVAGRNVLVFEPDEPRAAVLWLHGYDEQSWQGRSAFESAFATERLLVVAPSGGQGWWLDLPLAGFPADLTPARLVVDELPCWIESRWSFAPPRIGFAGVGMGGQGAVNLGFRNARRFPVVAAIAPDIDFHQWHGAGTALDQLFPSREAARQQTATLHLHPLNWPRHVLMVCDPDDPACFDGTERLASKLISSGIPFDCDFQTRAGGHSWEYFDAMIPQVAQFLGTHLSETGNSE
ncbi:MAG: alpha/beta hydrolase [Planctomycetaceae bacterium]